jgi:hypothetical protein
MILLCVNKYMQTCVNVLFYFNRIHYTIATLSQYEPCLENGSREIKNFRLRTTPIGLKIRGSVNIIFIYFHTIAAVPPAAQIIFQCFFCLPFWTHTTILFDLLYPELHLNTSFCLNSFLRPSQKRQPKQNV